MTKAIITLSVQSSKNKALGIIGGTGLYALEGFRNAQWVQVDSAFGPPSDELLIGELDGQRLVFLPRHGRGHRLSPTHVNYRANIEAMKRVGVIADHLLQRRRFAHRASAARRLRHRRPVHRPHVCPREELLRRRHGGAREHGRPCLPAVGGRH